LAVQYPPLQAREIVHEAESQGPAHTFSAGFYLLDGSPDDDPGAGFLAGLATVVPHPVHTVGCRDVPAVTSELANEAERRQQTQRRRAPALYRISFGLQRYRDPRKQEDDFGFSRREEKPTSAKQFSSILRDGPGVSVHALVWCDSFNNLNRTFDRQT